MYIVGMDDGTRANVDVGLGSTESESELLGLAWLVLARR